MAVKFIWPAAAVFPSEPTLAVTVNVSPNVEDDNAPVKAVANSSFVALFAVASEYLLPASSVNSCAPVTDRFTLVDCALPFSSR